MMKVLKPFRIRLRNTLPVYDDKYMKTKIRTYGHKGHTKFRGLHVPEDGVECKFFTIISTDLLIFMKTNITCKYI